MVLAALLLVIAFIVLTSTRLKISPFLSLLIAGLIMGAVGGLESTQILKTLTAGFGNTLQSIGIVIALGTIIGAYLEKSGGAQRMAETLIRRIGNKRSGLAMNITGFIVSIPVFCDSGFVILSTLNRAISRKTGVSMTVLAVALSTGLYATHVFVPPTPGPLAAAATLGADVGLVIIFGLLVAIPSSLAGWLWAEWVGKRLITRPALFDEPKDTAKTRPGFARSLLPLLVPIILIAMGSLSSQQESNTILVFLGHPVIALIIGVILAMTLKKSGASHAEWMQSGLAQAGCIILITGAGGAFGTILREIQIGDLLGNAFSGWSMGIILPFIVAAFFKTAQGSSTVSIITTAALMLPLLPTLGLTGAEARALTVLAIGAGAMTVSHANDSYFWVVAQFSNMDTATALKSHTMGTFLQGLTGIMLISILWLVFV
jgi:gluconate:H+ symporter, GntP family